jgi:hypothetical protein
LKFLGFVATVSCVFCGYDISYKSEEPEVSPAFEKSLIQPQFLPAYFRPLDFRFGSLGFPCPVPFSPPLASPPSKVKEESQVAGKVTHEDYARISCTAIAEPEPQLVGQRMAASSTCD